MKPPHRQRASQRRERSLSLIIDRLESLRPADPLAAELLTRIVAQVKAERNRERRLVG